MAVTTTPIYVTKEQYEEASSTENSTIGDLKITILKITDMLNKDDASIQQEIYNKSVKGDNKKNMLNIL